MTPQPNRYYLVITPDNWKTALVVAANRKAARQETEKALGKQKFKDLEPMVSKDITLMTPMAFQGSQPGYFFRLPDSRVFLATTPDLEKAKRGAQSLFGPLRFRDLGFLTVRRGVTLIMEVQFDAASKDFFSKIGFKKMET